MKYYIYIIHTHQSVYSNNKYVRASWSKAIINSESFGQSFSARKLIFSFFSSFPSRVKRKNVNRDREPRGDYRTWCHSERSANSPRFPFVTSSSSSSLHLISYTCRNFPYFLFFPPSRSHEHFSAYCRSFLLSFSLSSSFIIIIILFFSRYTAHPVLNESAKGQRKE